MRRGWHHLQTQRFLRGVCFALALVAFGVALSQYRTCGVQSRAIDAPMSYAFVTDRIVEIAPLRKGSKQLLEDLAIGKLPAERTPLQA